MTEADTPPREDSSNAADGDDGESRAMDLANELAALSSGGRGDAEAGTPEEGAHRDAEADAGDDAPEEAPGSDVDAGAEGEGGTDDAGVEDERGAEGSTEIESLRHRLEEAAPGLVGRSLDGVAGLRADDDGWVAIVEFVERSAVPDTQDILGRYRIELDDDGEIRGYDRLARYRRGDTRPMERGTTSAYE